MNKSYEEKVKDLTNILDDMVNVAQIGMSDEEGSKEVQQARMASIATMGKMIRGLIG